LRYFITVQIEGQKNLDSVALSNRRWYEFHLQAWGTARCEEAAKRCTN
jgi:hypothetical protein